MTPLLKRVRTSPAPAGVMVEVVTETGRKKADYGLIEKVSDAGPFRWLTSNGRRGDAPLFVGAVIASAHAIDESEATI